MLRNILSRSHIYFLFPSSYIICHACWGQDIRRSGLGKIPKQPSLQSPAPRGLPLPVSSPVLGNSVTHCNRPWAFSPPIGWQQRTCGGAALLLAEPRQGRVRGRAGQVWARGAELVSDVLPPRQPGYCRHAGSHTSDGDIRTEGVAGEKLSCYPCSNWGVETA